MRRVRTEPVVAVLLMAGRQNFSRMSYTVIERRPLRDYVQLAQSLVGHYAPHHQFLREFHAERLLDFSPCSLVLAVWVVEELKGRLVAEEEPFQLFHSPLLTFLAKLIPLGSLFFREFWPYADLVGLRSKGVPPVLAESR